MCPGHSPALRGGGMGWGARWNLRLATSLVVRAPANERRNRGCDPRIFPPRRVATFSSAAQSRSEETAMEIANFKDMYIAELQELVSVEDQLAEGLLRMAGVAAHPALKEALMHHSEQTQVQKERLDSILRKHGADSKAHTDQA